MSVTCAKKFVQLVGSNLSLQRELGRFFETSQKNNWQGLVDIARAKGFDMTIAELQDEVPEHFYLGFGPHPELGWDKPSMLRASSPRSSS